MTGPTWHTHAPDGWDARAVDAPGGHVYQSVAWAEHRRATGWAPWFVWSEDVAVLALSRPWPWLPGGSAYVPRGPAPPGGGDHAASALRSAVAVLETKGIDVVAADAEVPADDAAYRRALREMGFRSIEEIQPSRHRLTLPLDAAGGEDTALAGIAKSTRQRIRHAERAGLVVVRHDLRSATAGPAVGFTGPAEGIEPGGTEAGGAAAALERFYDLLLATGERRRFAFGPRERFLAWWRAAHAAGHLVLLEARDDGRTVAGLVLYRHGRRLSTVHSADEAETRDRHPGALHLLRWRAIQIALSEGRDEMDLGGVDVPGARRMPREGEPTWGLYQHKAAFGGRWLELTGAHQKVIRPWRYAAGRIASRIRRR
jgi:lipid II:glycine glycyltransferase (peptidoglycan interpeptide bridge formation enzyme)